MTHPHATWAAPLAVGALGLTLAWQLVGTMLRRDGRWPHG